MLGENTKHSVFICFIVFCCCFEKKTEGSHFSFEFVSNSNRTGISLSLNEMIFTARNRRLGQDNVFTSVCHSVQGGVYPSMHWARCVCILVCTEQRVFAQAKGDVCPGVGVSAHGVYIPLTGGRHSAHTSTPHPSSSGPEADTTRHPAPIPEMTTEVGSTYSTGMHYCFYARTNLSILNAEKDKECVKTCRIHQMVQLSCVRRRNSKDKKTRPAHYYLSKQDTQVRLEYIQDMF